MKYLLALFCFLLSFSTSYAGYNRMNLDIDFKIEPGFQISQENIKLETLSGSEMITDNKFTSIFSGSTVSIFPIKKIDENHHYKLSFTGVLDSSGNLISPFSVNTNIKPINNPYINVKESIITKDLLYTLTGSIKKNYGLDILEGQSKYYNPRTTVDTWYTHSRYRPIIIGSDINSFNVIRPNGFTSAVSGSENKFGEKKARMVVTTIGNSIAREGWIGIGGYYTPLKEDGSDGTKLFYEITDFLTNGTYKGLTGSGKINVLSNLGDFYNLTPNEDGLNRRDLSKHLDESWKFNVTQIHDFSKDYKKIIPGKYDLAIFNISQLTDEGLDIIISYYENGGNILLLEFPTIGNNVETSINSKKILEYFGMYWGQNTKDNLGVSFDIPIDYNPNTTSPIFDAIHKLVNHEVAINTPWLKNKNSTGSIISENILSETEINENYTIAEYGLLSDISMFADIVKQYKGITLDLYNFGVSKNTHPLTYLLIKRDYLLKDMNFNYGKYSSNLKENDIILNKEKVKIKLFSSSNYGRVYAGGKNWSDSGLYAKDKSFIEINVPESVHYSDSSYIDVVIGVKTDKVIHDTFRRPPIQSETFRLKVGKNKIYTHFGGLVSFVSQNTTAPKNSYVEFEVSNVYNAPYFKLGETTKDQWELYKKSNTPRGIISTDTFSLSVESYLLKDRTFLEIQEIADFYKRFGQTTIDIRGYNIGEKEDLPDKQYMITDQFGYYGPSMHHAGNPYVLAWDSAHFSNLVKFPYASYGTMFGLNNHEISHNIQNNDWSNTNGWNEPSTILFNAYISEKIGHLGEGFSYDIKNDPYKKNGNNAFKLLIKYFDGAFYGEKGVDEWDIIKQLEKDARNKEKDELLKGTTGDDLMYLSLSRTVKHDLKKYFDVWGLSVSENALNKIKDLKLPEVSDDIFDFSIPTPKIVISPTIDNVDSTSIEFDVTLSHTGYIHYTAVPETSRGFPFNKYWISKKEIVDGKLFLKGKDDNEGLVHGKILVDGGTKTTIKVDGLKPGIMYDIGVIGTLKAKDSIATDITKINGKNYSPRVRTSNIPDLKVKFGTELGNNNNIIHSAYTSNSEFNIYYKINPDISKVVNENKIFTKEELSDLILYNGTLDTNIKQNDLVVFYGVEKETNKILSIGKERFIINKPKINELKFTETDKILSLSGSIVGDGEIYFTTELGIFPKAGDILKLNNTFKLFNSENNKILSNKKITFYQINTEGFIIGYGFIIPKKITVTGGGNPGVGGGGGGSGSRMTCLNQHLVCKQNNSGKYIFYKRGNISCKGGNLGKKCNISNSFENFEFKQTIEELKKEDTTKGEIFEKIIQEDNSLAEKQAIIQSVKNNLYYVDVGHYKVLNIKDFKQNQALTKVGKTIDRKGFSEDHTELLIDDFNKIIGLISVYKDTQNKTIKKNIAHELKINLKEFNKLYKKANIDKRKQNIAASSTDNQLSASKKDIDYKKVKEDILKAHQEKLEKQRELDKQEEEIKTVNTNDDIYAVSVHSVQLKYDRNWKYTTAWLGQGDKVKVLIPFNSYGIGKVEVIESKNSQFIGKQGFISKKYLK